MKGVVYVVDSMTFPKRTRDVAELLYDVLYASGNAIPTLVACNKQDEGMAKSAKVMHTFLEKPFILVCRGMALFEVR